MATQNYLYHTLIIAVYIILLCFDVLIDISDLYQILLYVYNDYVLDSRLQHIAIHYYLYVRFPYKLKWLTH